MGKSELTVDREIPHVKQHVVTELCETAWENHYSRRVSEAEFQRTFSSLDHRALQNKVVTLPSHTSDGILSNDCGSVFSYKIGGIRYRDALPLVNHVSSESVECPVAKAKKLGIEWNLRKQQKTCQTLLNLSSFCQT